MGLDCLLLGGCVDDCDKKFVRVNDTSQLVCILTVYGEPGLLRGLADLVLSSDGVDAGVVHSDAPDDQFVHLLLNVF